MVLHRAPASAPADAEPHVLRSLADATPRPYWLDAHPRPEPAPALVGATRADLVVVGGGFTGLWTALQAKEDDPSLDVVLLEAREIGWAASGRNGGFVESSLTHGLLNGIERFPDELATIERLGAENLQGMEDTLERYSIDCAWQRNGGLAVATQEWQLDDLASMVDVATRHGGDVDLWDRDRIQAEVHSPTYIGAMHEKDGTAIVDPALLAFGLRRAAIELGVRVHEHTPATALTEESGRMVVSTPYGRVEAPRVALGTNVFPNLVKRARAFVVPVWDYVLVTEPLTDEQWDSIGWANRQGIGDSANQFHYYRPTVDGRILWGGYDAIYYYGNGLGDRYENRPETYAKLATHFFDTFPQLEGLRFSHVWGGAIDTCTRFCAFWGQAYGGKVAYVLGYTGLGVGATRFGGRVMLDLLAGERNERTELSMVRKKPIPFPPEPFRYAGVQMTRWSIDRADRTQGRRNLWLRTLDSLGLGFDS